MSIDVASSIFIVEFKFHDLSKYLPIWIQSYYESLIISVFNLLHTNAPFLYPLRTSGFLTFSGDDRNEAA